MAEKRKRFGFEFPERPNCVTVYSGKRLVMENVERIVFCSSEKMILEGKERLVIEGSSLELKELGNDNMAVCGKILSIAFEEVSR